MYEEKNTKHTIQKIENYLDTWTTRLNLIYNNKNKMISNHIVWKNAVKALTVTNEEMEWKLDTVLHVKCVIPNDTLVQIFIVFIKTGGEKKPLHYGSGFMHSHRVLWFGLVLSSCSSSSPMLTHKTVKVRYFLYLISYLLNYREQKMKHEWLIFKASWTSFCLCSCSLTRLCSDKTET